jgi:chromosome partitioning protein
MDVVAVIAQKGGTGKTTLCLSLAVAAQQAGKNVAIVDLDPQATAANWADRRGTDNPPLVVSAQPARLAHVLKTAEDGGIDLVVIDTPPRAEQAAIAAAKAAQLVLIPCRPAVFDLDTVSTTLELLKVSGVAPMAAVLNGVPAVGGEAEQAADVLKDLGLAVCPARLGYRKAFTHAGALGKGAQEFDPSGKAADEIKQVYEFMCKLIKQSTQKGANSDGETSRSTKRNAG